MRLVPESNDAKATFYRAHIDAWVAHAEAIGLSSETAMQLQAILADAEQALRTQREAQQAARAATQAATHAIETLSRFGAAATSTGTTSRTTRSWSSTRPSSRPFTAASASS